MTLTAQPAHHEHPDRETQPAATGPDDVNAALTPAGAPTDHQDTPTRRPARRRRPNVENTDYAAFAARVIRAHARRVAGGDVEALADLLALARELDTATDTAVQGLRAFGYSWAEIATRLGTTRQAAQQRWGTK